MIYRGFTLRFVNRSSEEYGPDWVVYIDGKFANHGYLSKQDAHSDTKRAIDYQLNHVLADEEESDV